ncbi:MAG: RHS repeat-associated core domain-containing protein, partial [Candidatus Acidiferrales bacterium]
MYKTDLAYYRHSDWLGSSRFASTPSRTLYYDGAYGPFGELYAQTGTTDVSFTGMNQDRVANLYDFPAREYGTQGRWPSPDPSGLSSVHLRDPQTLNRYAYVRNNPLRLTDPTGLDLIDDDGNGFEQFGDGEGGFDNSGDADVDADDGEGEPYQGCEPGDFSCNPFSDNGCLDPWAGSCGSASGTAQSIAAGNGADSDGDPCVYTNSDGTYNVDTNSSPKECAQTQGNWVPPGYQFAVDSN